MYSFFLKRSIKNSLKLCVLRTALLSFKNALFSTGKFMLNMLSLTIKISLTKEVIDMNYMDEALKEAYEGIEKAEGGPFGSVIVKDGKIVGRGHNRVLLKHDPTCHGEMEAIRNACKNLGTHDLSGCELYTTAEPCPMCLGGILWANIKTVYYGCNREDTDSIGFRDDIFYEYMNGKKDLLVMSELQREDCLKLFRDYSDNDLNERY